MQVTRWTMELPGYTPTSVNKLLSVHWGSRSKIKQKDYDIIAMACMLYGVPPAEGKRHVRLLIVLGKGQRATDADNICKIVLDGLVKCGALKNDSRDWVSYEQAEFARGEKPVTFLTLEDAG